MEKNTAVADVDVSAPSEMEDSMEPITAPITVPPASPTQLLIACAHSRMIHEVLIGSENQSGTVRCLECGATFDDPLFDFFFKD